MVQWDESGCPFLRSCLFWLVDAVLSSSLVGHPCPPHLKRSKALVLIVSRLVPRDVAVGQVPVVVTDARPESATRWRKSTAVGSRPDPLNSGPGTRHGDTWSPRSCDDQPAEWSCRDKTSLRTSSGVSLAFIQALQGLGASLLSGICRL